MKKKIGPAQTVCTDTKHFVPAQNILRPVKGQGNSLRTTPNTKMLQFL